MLGQGILLELNPNILVRDEERMDNKTLGIRPGLLLALFNDSESAEWDDSVYKSQCQSVTCERLEIPLPSGLETSGLRL